MDTLGQMERANYVTAALGIRSWVLARDHKRVALLYLVAATLFFVAGGVLAVLMRLDLLTSAGDLVQSDTYNKLFTLHGVLMAFFFLAPSIPAVLGNFLLPLMVGVDRLRFPRLNLLSFYLFLAGGLCIVWGAFGGGVDTGWDFSLPYAAGFSHTKVGWAAFGILLGVAASFLTGLNFVFTVHGKRATGSAWRSLPVFVWAHYITGAMLLFGAPIGAVFFLSVILDPGASSALDDPATLRHLFWVFAEATVYVVVVPAIGVASEIVSCFARRRIQGYPVVVLSLLALPVLGIVSWTRHLPPGMVSPTTAVLAALPAYLLVVPLLLLAGNLVATLLRGTVSYSTPMLYALGVVGLLLVGGLGNLFLVAGASAIQLRGTAFETAQFHYFVAGATLMAFLGGLHFWWPKITGRLYPRLLAMVGAVVVFVGFNLTFLPQFALGYLGMATRHHVYAPDLQVLHALSTAGATILGLGYLLPVVYLSWSLRYGRPSEDNPWQAKGLEWQTSSPPPPENFLVPPVVTAQTYES